MDITPPIIIFLFLLIILLAIFVSWSSSPGSYAQSRTYVFIAALTGIGLISISFVYYLSVMSMNQHQKRLFVVGETSRLAKLSSSSVQEEMVRASAVVPSFVASLMPEVGNSGESEAGGASRYSWRRVLSPSDFTLKSVRFKKPAENSEIKIVESAGAERWRDFAGGETEERARWEPERARWEPERARWASPDPETVQAEAERRALSTKIFTLWEEMLTADGYLAFDETSYIAGFLQYGGSEQLYKQWRKLRSGYNEKTQMLGELLFEYGGGKRRGLECLSEADSEVSVRRQRGDFRWLAKKLIADERYSDF